MNDRNMPPWMVAFVRYAPGGGVELVECAGTLIAASWVLTAAHAVIDPRTTTAVIGAESLARCPATNMRAVRHVFRHPRYDWHPAVPLHDLALVQLETPYAIDAYVPRHIAPTACAYGWGGDAMKTPAIVVERMLGVSTGGREICYGDSGAPLMLDVGGTPHQVGVASCVDVARECRRGTLFTILTEEYCAWMDRTMACVEKAEMTDDR